LAGFKTIAQKFADGALEQSMLYSARDELVRSTKVGVGLVLVAVSPGVGVVAVVVVGV